MYEPKDKYHIDIADNLMVNPSTSLHRLSLTC